MLRFDQRWFHSCTSIFKCKYLGSAYEVLRTVYTVVYRVPVTARQEHHHAGSADGSTAKGGTRPPSIQGLRRPRYTLQSGSRLGALRRVLGSRPTPDPFLLRNIYQSQPQAPSCKSGVPRAGWAAACSGIDGKPRWSLWLGNPEAPGGNPMELAGICPRWP